LYIPLPSKGLYYPPGVLTGDYNNVPVFAMTGMDEIIMKTPDALFSGEATGQVIKSCVPYISDPSKVPSIDIDALIVAIRIATYGENLTVERNCVHCGSENQYDIPINYIIEYFNSQKFNNTIKINDEITLKIRPLAFEDSNLLAIDNFKIQKKLQQIPDVAEDQQQAFIDEIYKDLAELQLSLFMHTIESVKIPDAEIDDQAMILDWLKNSDRDLFAQIKETLEKNRDIWNIPPQQVQCGSCQQPNKIDLILDQATFFV
jgi:hypothetical protein